MSGPTLGDWIPAEIMDHAWTFDPAKLDDHLRYVSDATYHGAIYLLVRLWIAAHRRELR